MLVTDRLLMDRLVPRSVQSSTSSVIATAKIPLLKSASRSTLSPLTRL